MLYVPFAVGLLAASSISLSAMFLLVSVSFVFIARESLLAWWRSRTRAQQDIEALRYLAGYLLMGGTFAIPLFVVWGLYWLAPFAAGAGLLLGFNMAQASRRDDRTATGEILAIIGLTMTAPAAYYVARGALELTALWLWVLCAMYFASSVFYVKLRVNTLNPRKEQARRQWWRRCAVYHVSLLAFLMAMGLGGSVSLLVVVAFLPALARSFWHLTRPVSRINLRLVGWLEIIYSVVFLVFMTLTFRFGH